MKVRLQVRLHPDDDDDDDDDHDHPFDADDLVCPISQEIVKDPVVLWPSHQTYDREQICRSLLLYPNLDPATGVRYNEGPLEYESDLCTRHHLIRKHGRGAYRPYDDSGFAQQYETKWNEWKDGGGGNFGGDSINNIIWEYYDDSSDNEDNDDDEFMSFALAVSLVEQLRAASTRPRAVRTLNVILHQIVGADGGGEREIGIFVQHVGGIQAVVDTMRRFGAEPCVQELACRVLHGVSCGSEQNKIQIALDGGIEAIVEAMNSCLISMTREQRRRRPVLFGAYQRRMEKKIAAVQIRAFNALRLLVYGNRENQSRFADAGGIEAIVLAMKSLGSIPKVQVEALRVLDKVAGIERNRIQIAAAGGIEAIVHTMKVLSSEAVVQENACRVLYELAYNTCDDRTRIASAGGIEALVAALKQHTSLPAVQEKACLVLRQMAFCHASRLRIAAAGGIEAILAALTNHPFESAVQTQACWALWNLAVDYTHCMRILDAGTIETVRAAMNRHPSVPTVRKAGIGILRCLLPYDKFVEEIGATFKEVRHSALGYVVAQGFLHSQLLFREK